MWSNLLRTAWLVLAYFALCVSAEYVQQLRLVVVGFCPPTVGVPGVLVFDSLQGRTGCAPLPQAPSPLPPSDKKTES